MKHTCSNCQNPRTDKGRAMDGRRAYRCTACGNTWTEGLQGRQRRYSPQRPSYQFADTGAARYAGVTSLEATTAAFLGATVKPVPGKRSKARPQLLAVDLKEHEERWAAFADNYPSRG